MFYIQYIATRLPSKCRTLIIKQPLPSIFNLLSNDQLYIFYTGECVFEVQNQGLFSRLARWLKVCKKKGLWTALIFLSLFLELKRLI